MRERQFWDQYAAAYDQLLNAITTDWAPWYVIPADRKWFVRAAIADIVVAKLDSLGLMHPRMDRTAAALLASIREHLEREPQANRES